MQFVDEVVLEEIVPGGEAAEADDVTAETAICNLADTVLTARGERSRYLGPDKRYVDHVTLDATNLQSDTLFTDIRNRRVVDKLLADPKRGPGAQTRKLVKGYAAGVNAYLRDIGGSRNITDPALLGLQPHTMPGILPMKVIKVGSAAQSRIAQACDR